VTAVPDEMPASGPPAVTGQAPGSALPASRAEPGQVPGSAPDASALPAGPAARSFTIALPPGLKLLSLNGREHWAERHRRSEALKKAAWALALQARIPRLERVSVVAEYQPAPVRRRRDADNPMPSVKACLDGIVAAGVLADDESPRYVSEITARIGEPYPRGRLVLHLTELAALGGAA
jgi:crossover junction endodeoxyribonuclease RusA